MRITSEVAHSILVKLKKLLNYNINIMNSDGVIVGSTDSSRLNQIHQGALMVFDTKKAIFIYSEDEAHFPGAKPGVNLPIEIQKEIIGCIGVTGEPNDVIQFAQILKVTVEVMLQEMELFNQLQYENKLAEKWVLDFVHPSHFHASKLEADGLHYLNLDFQKNISIFLIRFTDFLPIMKHQDMEEVVKNRKKKDERLHQLKTLLPSIVFSSFLEDDNCIIAVPPSKINYQTAADSIHTYFLNQGVKVKIGIGGSYNGIEGYRKSYLEACDSLKLLEKFPKPNEVAHISDWGIITLFQQVPEETLKSFYAQYLPEEVTLNEEQIHTLEVLYNNALNMKVTAEELHIHRNTLLYRLDSISRKTGLDPKNFHDALLLRVLLVIEKLAFK
ncbi:CdaR family transcriptional regulator [Robertmurraya sp.]|jgi:carbohydrate diacid regulator|uniref:CdaR family transcriptional regulator n=1 Tax=Robertmurraya sp. TaxID=2837525 RepID=UPI0037037310